VRTGEGSNETRIDGLGKRAYIIYYRPIGVKSNIIHLFRLNREAESAIST
jgi:hypothetical protein